MLASRFLYIFIFLFLSFQAFIVAQEEINGEAFLNNYLVDNTLSIVENSSKVRIPWIESYDFRTETHDNEFRNQEYSLRLKPNSIGKFKAQKKYSRLLSSKPNFDYLDHHCDLVKDAHEDWLDLYYIEKKLELFKELEKIHQWKKNLLDEKKSSLEFTVEDLLEFEMENSNIKATFLDLNNKRELLLSSINMGEKSLNFDDLMSIEELYILSESIIAQKSLNEQEDNYELNLTEKEIKLEKSERRALFDFFQFRYSGPHAQPWSERISFGIGMNLDREGNDKIKLQELRIKKEEIDFKKKLDRFEAAKKTEGVKKELEFAVVKYFQIQEIMELENKNLNELSKKILQSGMHDPNHIIEIENRIINNRIDLLKEKKDIYELFIEVLEEAEIFCTLPYQFYLSK